MAFGSNGMGFGGDRQSADSIGVTGGVPVASAMPAERAAFLNKVYLTLCGGVALAMGCGFFTAGSPLVQGFLHMGAIGYLLIFGLYIGMTYMVQAVATKPGLNVLAYGAFTAATGILILAPIFYVAIAVTGNYQVIWNAFWLSAAVFGGLTGFVIVTGKNFSYMGGTLFVGLLVLIAFSFGAMFFHSTAVQLGVTCGGLFLFALFVLYDTSVIMHELSADMWITGALRMFLDFINIFIRVLMLLLQFNNRR